MILDPRDTVGPDPAKAAGDGLSQRLMWNCPGTMCADDPEQFWAALLEDPGLGGEYDSLLVALVAVARPTRLGRFYPFTSMARLCFAADYDRELGPQGLLPLHAQFAPGPVFDVMRGSLVDAVVKLQTGDPERAVAGLLELLDAI